MKTIGREDGYIIEMEWFSARPGETWTITNERDARLWYGQLATQIQKLGLRRVVLFQPDGAFEQTLAL